MFAPQYDGEFNQMEMTYFYLYTTQYLFKIQEKDEARRADVVRNDALQFSACRI